MRTETDIETNKKALLQEYNEGLLAQFKLYGRKGDALKLYGPSRIPGRLAEVEPTIYTKQTIDISGDRDPEHKHSLDVIYRNGRFDSLIFNTTDPAVLENFKTTCLLPSETLTSRAIVALNRYHVKTLSRLYHANIFSNKYLKKQNMLEKATQAIIDLQNLEKDGEYKVVAQETLRILRALQKENQLLTYQNGPYALLRGDLHSYCEDAIKSVHDFISNPHAVVLPEHQGDYGRHTTNTNTIEKNKKIFSIDLSYLGHDAERIDEALMQIAWLSDEERLSYDTLEPFAVRATKWSTHLALSFRCKQILAVILNLLTGIIFGLLIDFPVGFIFAFFQMTPPPSLTEWLKWTPISPHLQDTEYLKLKKEVDFTQDSLGAQLGTYLGRILRSTIIDLVKGVEMTARSFSIELYDDLRQDYLSARHEKKYAETVEILLVNIFSALEKKIVEAGYGIKPNTEAIPNKIIIAPPYSLKTTELKDAFNALADGGKLFVETFSHNIHTKHSFLGLLFNVTYLFGGMAIMAPHLFSFLGAEYIGVSNTIGHAMAHSQLTGSIASGFTQAKITAATLEAILHGRDSWAITAINKFAQNPADLLIVTSSAITLGWFIAFKIPIPILSEVLKEDLGNVSFFALGFAGLKLGILTFELINSHTPEKSLFYQMTPDVCDHLIPHLSYQTRRGLLDRIRQQYPEDRTLQQAARHIFMPTKTQSILSTTLLLITDYIPLLIRCIASLVTLSTQPWYDLYDKIQQDIARLILAISTILHTVCSFVGVMLRGLGDILGNEILARLEGVLRHGQKESYIGNITYGISTAVDQTYISICHFLPFTRWARSVTTAPPCSLSVSAHGVAPSPNEISVTQP